jgi:methyl-accepting chemotaxis protein
LLRERDRHQVLDSSKIATEAVKQAQRTDARIAKLSHSASRIGDVVKLITAIAEQTNLLALNATIEAARAGEAGRGFAIVAQEVKALASQTAKATDEIGTQISDMQRATNESVGAIKEIGGTIARISEISSSVASAVEEQGAANPRDRPQCSARGRQYLANGHDHYSGARRRVTDRRRVGRSLVIRAIACQRK